MVVMVPSATSILPSSVPAGSGWAFARPRPAAKSNDPPATAPRAVLVIKLNDSPLAVWRDPCHTGTGAAAIGKDPPVDPASHVGKPTLTGGRVQAYPQSGGLQTAAPRSAGVGRGESRREVRGR